VFAVTLLLVDLAYFSEFFWLCLISEVVSLVLLHYFLALLSIKTVKLFAVTLLHC